jgi:transposase
LKPVVSTSVLAAVSDDGLLDIQQRKGSYNKESFVAFLKQSKIPRHAVILLDNVAFHHAKPVLDLAREREWTLLHTPPYSPWFNPIEGVFSIMKRCYYRYRDIDRSINSVSVAHCRSFMRNSMQCNGVDVTG